MAIGELTTKFHVLRFPACRRESTLCIIGDDVATACPFIERRIEADDTGSIRCHLARPPQRSSRWAERESEKLIVEGFAVEAT